jgi:hypothetical protein
MSPDVAIRADGYDATLLLFSSTLLVGALSPFIISWYYDVAVIETLAARAGIILFALSVIGVLGAFRDI